MKIETNLISRFLEAADYLFSHSLIVGKELKVSTKRTWKKGEPWKVERHEIDVERFESLLLRLRIFCIQKDGINFEQVANLVGRLIESKSAIDDIRMAKKLFDGRIKDRASIRFNVRGELFGLREIFDLSLYGEMFHVNDSKRREILGIRTLFGDDVQDVLTHAAIDKVNAISFLCYLIRTHLKIEQDVGDNAI